MMIDFLRGRLSLLWQVEKQRYRLKGPVNILLSITFLILYFWVFMTVGHMCWPDHVENQTQFIMIGSICCSLIPAIIMFLAHLPGYFGHAAYKKYQNNIETPRPWEKKDWPQKLTTSIFLVSFNQLVGIPFLVFMGSRSKSKAHFG